MTTTTDLRDALVMDYLQWERPWNQEAFAQRLDALIEAAVNEGVLIGANTVRDERSAEVAALVEALDTARAEARSLYAILTTDAVWSVADAQDMAATLIATLRAALAQTPPTPEEHR